MRDCFSVHRLGCGMEHSPAKVRHCDRGVLSDPPASKHIHNVILDVLGLHSGKERCLGNEAKTDALNAWSFMAVLNVSQLLWAGLLGDLSDEESVDIVALVVLISSKAFQVDLNETMTGSRALT